jgi:hypothetical protein
MWNGLADYTELDYLQFWYHRTYGPISGVQNDYYLQMLTSEAPTFLMTQALPPQEHTLDCTTVRTYTAPHFHSFRVYTEDFYWDFEQELTWDVTEEVSRWALVARNYFVRTTVKEINQELKEYYYAPR